MRSSPQTATASSASGIRVRNGSSAIRRTRRSAALSTSSFQNGCGSRHGEGYRRVMATGDSHYGESDVLSVPALRKDGASVSVEFTIVPLQENGRLIAVAAIMRDVSKRFEETRSLKRKLAELSRASS